MGFPRFCPSSPIRLLLILALMLSLSHGFPARRLRPLFEGTDVGTGQLMNTFIPGSYSFFDEDDDEYDSLKDADGSNFYDFRDDPYQHIRKIFDEFPNYCKVCQRGPTFVIIREIAGVTCFVNSITDSKDNSYGGTYSRLTRLPVLNFDCSVVDRKCFGLPIYIVVDKDYNGKIRKVIQPETPSYIDYYYAFGETYQKYGFHVNISLRSCSHYLSFIGRQNSEFQNHGGLRVLPLQQSDVVQFVNESLKLHAKEEEYEDSDDEDDYDDIDDKNDDLFPEESEEILGDDGTKNSSIWDVNGEIPLESQDNTSELKSYYPAKRKKRSLKGRKTLGKRGKRSKKRERGKQIPKKSRGNDFELRKSRRRGEGGVGSGKGSMSSSRAKFPKQVAQSFNSKFKKFGEGMKKQIDKLNMSRWSSFLKKFFTVPMSLIGGLVVIPILGLIWYLIKRLCGFILKMTCSCCDRRDPNNNKC